MAVVRWRPMRDVFTLQDEINRMFEEMVGRPEQETGMMRMMPAADIVENADNFVVTAELPGMKKDDIKVTLQNNVLTISGEKKKEEESKEGTYHRVERSYGSFVRTFELPATVDPSRIKADYTDGILYVELPKSEEARPREITINVG